jgi:RAT1-interacting protein
LGGGGGNRKLIKFYFQSFLLGVPEILVGFRSTRGILQQTQIFPTLELPRLVRGKPNAWDPNVCLDWGNQLLENIKVWMADLSPSDVGRIVFTPGTGVTFSRLDDDQVLEVVAAEDRVGFLPTWYYTERLKTAPL